MKLKKYILIAMLGAVICSSNVFYSCKKKSTDVTVNPPVNPGRYHHCESAG